MAVNCERGSEGERGEDQVLEEEGVDFHVFEIDQLPASEGVLMQACCNVRKSLVLLRCDEAAHVS